MIEFTISLKNDEGKPEGFVMAIDPMILRVLKETHGTEPYKYILETLQTSLDTSNNPIAVRMKTIIDEAVNSIPAEEVVKQLSNTISQGE